MYYPAHGNNLSEKRDKLEFTAEHQVLSISEASNVPGYEERQCFVVEGEGRGAALQTVTAFAEHLERIAEQAGELGRQRFAPLLNRLEETCTGEFPTNRRLRQPACPSRSRRKWGRVPVDDETEEDDDEETEEDRAFIDDDEDDLKGEDDLSFYLRVDLQLAERRHLE